MEEERNIEFICFTSASGGSGCSSAAVAAARIMSRLFSKRILILSFDALSCKTSPVNTEKISVKRLLVRLLDMPADSCNFPASVCRDDFGVSYLADRGIINPLRNAETEDLDRLLDAVSKSELFDAVFIDLPLGNNTYDHIAAMCEKIVVVCGWTEGQNRPNQELLKYLKSAFKKLEYQPQISCFRPLEDCESFEDGDVEIHGQFGAEVRQLVSELFDGI